MKTHAGLWIDHRKAGIVLADCEGTRLSVIPSHVDRQFGRTDGIKSTVSFETFRFPTDDTADRAFQHHLNVYYGKVIAAIREADSIQIFGPGEAKIELARQLEKVNLHGRIISIETADKMTDAQITARVWGVFLERNLNQPEPAHAGT